MIGYDILHEQPIKLHASYRIKGDLVEQGTVFQTFKVVLIEYKFYSICDIIYTV